MTRRNINVGGKRYFKTLRADDNTRSGTATQSVFSRLQLTSTNMSEIDFDTFSQMRTDQAPSRYKPAISGMLSPNPQTGTVQVNFDQKTMSIVVQKKDARGGEDLAMSETMLGTEAIGFALKTIEQGR